MTNSDSRKMRNTRNMIRFYILNMARFIPGHESLIYRVDNSSMMQEFQLLSIPEDAMVTLSGNIDVQLPGYMTVLTCEELLGLQNVQNPKDYIVSAGHEAKTGDIVLLTADGSIREIRSKFKRFKEPIRCLPVNYGRAVIFNDDIKIASSEMLDIARGATVRLSGDISVKD